MDEEKRLEGIAEKVGLYGYEIGEVAFFNLVNGFNLVCGPNAQKYIANLEDDNIVRFYSFNCEEHEHIAKRIKTEARNLTIVGGAKIKLEGSILSSNDYSGLYMALPNQVGNIFLRLAKREIEKEFGLDLEINERLEGHQDLYMINDFWQPRN